MPYAVYHLGLNSNDVKDCAIAILPGDPERVPLIAKHLEKAKELAHHREFRSMVGLRHGHKILVCSTGLGGASASVCLEELAQLGIKRFLRVGTCGAIQPHIQVGDIIITSGAVRWDGVSEHIVPLAYPAIADYEMVHRLTRLAEHEGLRHHVGITVSSATFYQGQGRKDTYRDVTPFTPYENSIEYWKQIGALNFEMEAATVLTMASVYGLKAACLTGVLINRVSGEIPKQQSLFEVEHSLSALAVKAALSLVSL